MRFVYSRHWALKKSKRKDITEDMIEYCVLNSKQIKDRYFEDLLNAIERVPPSGRTLKVVYKLKDKGIKIITAYWID